MRLTDAINDDTLAKHPSELLGLASLVDALISDLATFVEFGADLTKGPFEAILSCADGLVATSIEGNVMVIK